MGHKSGEFADYSAPMVLTPIETESGGGSRGGGVECHTAGRDARLPLATMVAAQQLLLLLWLLLVQLYGGSHWQW